MIFAQPQNAAETGARRSSAIWILIGAATAAIALAVLVKLPVSRFGDGSEYYALYLAILNHARPFMTEGAWSDYTALFDSGTIVSLVDAATLRGSFPTLADAHTADFNHFWFYPALAAAVAAPLKFVGISLHPNTAFLVLHAILFGATVSLAGRLQGARGAVAVLLLFVASPVLWFSAKVHTEFFTVALVLQSFILISRGKLLYAALPVALASTQNISIAATAWALIALGVLANRAYKRSTTAHEMAAVALALSATALHPLYYLYRHGVITPQLKAGGATVGGNIAQWKAVLINPDIGLLPNWWLGTFILISGLVIAARYRPRLNLGYIAISVAYFATNLFAQASTINLNSGSIDLSRYALWYVPVFYGPLVWLIGEATRKPIRWLAALLLAGIATPLIAWNVKWYWPSRYERYLEPTFASGLLLSRFPGMYDPPPEIFIERNSGYGETSLPPLAVIAGPGCRKLYVPPALADAKPIKVISQHPCVFDEDKVAALVAARLAQRPQIDKGNGMYISLSRNGLRRLRPQFNFGEGRINFAAGAKGSAALIDGWSTSESWGTWSNATHSRVEINLTNCGTDFLHVTISAQAFVTPQNPRVVAAVEVGDRQVGTLDFTSDNAASKQLEFDYACTDIRKSDSQLVLNFAIDGAAAPSSLGTSADSRLLGIGLQWIEIKRQPSVAD